MDRMINLGGLMVATLIASLLAGIVVKWWGEMDVGYRIALLIPLGLAIIVVYLVAKENLKRKKKIN